MPSAPRTTFIPVWGIWPSLQFAGFDASAFSSPPIQVAVPVTGAGGGIVTPTTVASSVVGFVPSPQVKADAFGAIPSTIISLLMPFGQLISFVVTEPSFSAAGDSARMLTAIVAEPALPPLLPMR